MLRTVALVYVLAACTPPSQRGTRSAPGEPPTTAGEPASAGEARPPQAAAGGTIEALPVPGFGPAVVVMPAPSARPAALLVAAHGAGDSPEWQCEHWSHVAHGRFFILCPRGLSLGAAASGESGYYYPNHPALERELVAALAAVRQRYAGVVRTSSGVYTGYSQGATMGALMVVDHGADFPHLVLIEGGWSEWTLARAKRFLATGGRTVAFVCGGAGCAGRARASAVVLERAGVRARVEHVEGGGHTYTGPMGKRAAEVLEALIVDAK